MEGYAYSYPDSGDSSPRSREIDFENPPSSWDIDHQPPPTNVKVKFMVSYGGKIQPRSHDNQLAYVGGETKILAVDRTVKFSVLLSKLVNLITEDNNNNNNSNNSNNSNNGSNNLCITSFKYQLPGEDLDALISVTNDDDLEHMMHEYDRLYRGSSKPARLRLFAFPTSQTGFGSGSSDKLDRDRFVDALNSGPVPVPVPVQVPDHQAPPVGVNNNMDFLFGLEGKNPAQVPVQVPVHPDRVIPDLNRLQISSEHHQMQQQQQNPVGNVVGDVYQKPQPTIPASAQIPASYWQPPTAPPPQPTVSLEHQPPPAQQPQHQHQHQHQQPIPPPQSQPVYMIHHPPPQANMYHAPVVRPPPPQGYYQVQRVTSDQVYGIPGPQKVVYSTEGMGGAGVPFMPVAGENTVGGGGGYHVAYDNTTGRQVYYPAQGGGVGLGGGGGGGGGGGTMPFSGDVSRTGQVHVQGHGQGVGLTGSEGKVVQKASPTSATL